MTRRQTTSAFDAYIRERRDSNRARLYRSTLLRLVYSGLPRSSIKRCLWVFLYTLLTTGNLRSVTQRMFILSANLCLIPLDLLLRIYRTVFNFMFSWFTTMWKSVYLAMSVPLDQLLQTPPSSTAFLFLFFSGTCLFFLCFFFNYVFLICYGLVQKPK